MVHWQIMQYSCKMNQRNSHIKCKTIENVLEIKDSNYLGKLNTSIYAMYILPRIQANNLMGLVSMVMSRAWTSPNAFHERSRHQGPHSSPHIYIKLGSTVKTKQLFVKPWFENQNGRRYHVLDGQA